MVGHHRSGAGGATQYDGSVSWDVNAGITNVMCLSVAASNASSKVCSPPQTQPSEESDV